jgi:hypothetical protein
MSDNEDHITRARGNITEQSRGCSFVLNAHTFNDSVQRIIKISRRKGYVPSSYSRKASNPYHDDLR